MAFLYISRRELSNGGLHSSGDLKLTPARFVDHPATVVVHAVLVLKPVHAVLDQRFMAVLFRIAATVRELANNPEFKLSQAVLQPAVKLVKKRKRERQRERERERERECMYRSSTPASPCERFSKPSSIQNLLCAIPIALTF